jgi:hypothetical protein
MYKKVSVLLALLVLMATSAMATTPAALIDYSNIAGDLTGILQTAITAAIGVGVLVLGARFGWRFFKSFAK